MILHNKISPNNLVLSSLKEFHEFISSRRYDYVCFTNPDLYVQDGIIKINNFVAREKTILDLCQVINPSLKQLVNYHLLGLEYDKAVEILKKYLENKSIYFFVDEINNVIITALNDKELFELQNSKNDNFNKFIDFISELPFLIDLTTVLIVINEPKVTIITKKPSTCLHCAFYANMAIPKRYAAFPYLVEQDITLSTWSTFRYQTGTVENLRKTLLFFSERLDVSSECNKIKPRIGLSSKYFLFKNVSSVADADYRIELLISEILESFGKNKNRYRKFVTKAVNELITKNKYSSVLTTPLYELENITLYDYLKHISELLNNHPIQPQDIFILQSNRYLLTKLKSSMW